MLGFKEKPQIPFIDSGGPQDGIVRSDTGARVGEIAQLWKQDVTQRGEHWVIRITPEAGTVKTNEAREVVLHRQLVELGFPEFVKASPDGHLFLTPAAGGVVRGPLRAVGIRAKMAQRKK